MHYGASTLIFAATASSCFAASFATPFSPPRARYAAAAAIRRRCRRFFAFRHTFSLMALRWRRCCLFSLRHAFMPRARDAAAHYAAITPLIFDTPFFDDAASLPPPLRCRCFHYAAAICCRHDAADAALIFAAAVTLPP
jgi:hypothetical protein